jgi:hypothetical protein
VNLEVTEPVPRDRPAEIDHQAAAKPLEASILAKAADLADAYCILAVTPYGRQRRRLFLSLHSAVAAVKRARERGLPCELILCRLVPLDGADLDGGEQP